MKLAVVGSGVSGLVAAHLLQRRHDVTVFEADDRIGGHVHTVPVEVDGVCHAIDTGFIVFNDRTYPNFVRLLDQLGVGSDETDMSFSISCERTGIEYASRSTNAVFAQRRNLLRPRFHRMLRDVLRFHREAPGLLEQDDEKVTLGDWVCGAGYGVEFVERHLVPLGSAIWSARPDQLLEFPARSFVRFCANHGLLSRDDRLQWRVVRGGSNEYVRRLVEPLRQRIRLSTPVASIRRTATGVEVSAAGAAPERFDEVVLAVHSDQALRLLADPSLEERRILSSVRYQENEAVLHTDERLLPRCQRARASWNYRIPRQGNGRAFVTYHMNRLQNLEAPVELCVTLNPGDAIDPSKVVASYTYHHPIFDSAAVAAQEHHGLISGVRRTHYCGAWWRYGFHEDGVESALRVARRFGETL